MEGREEPPPHLSPEENISVDLVEGPVQGTFSAPLRRILGTETWLTRLRILCRVPKSQQSAEASIPGAQREGRGVITRLVQVCGVEMLKHHYIDWQISGDTA